MSRFIVDETADGNQWNFKKYTVVNSEHPKLFWKYEVYEGEKFIGRFLTKKEIKEKLCN